MLQSDSGFSVCFKKIGSGAHPTKNLSIKIILIFFDLR